MIETVVALGLVGVSLLVATAYLDALSRSQHRIAAGEKMAAELEAASEMMRAGVVPLQSGAVFAAGLDDEYPDFEVTAVVADSDLPGLYDVTLKARCSVDRRTATATLQTLVWRP